MTQATWGRAELIKSLYQQTSLSLSESADVVKEMINILKEGLIEEGQVKIKGFAKFEVYDRKARIGRNPKTREEKIICVRKAIRFKRSSLLEKKIKKGEEN